MSYKTDIENNNQRLENNNQDIDNIIQQVTNIPTFSDVTATEGDVLVDKTYYGKGIKRIGTMANVGQQIVTPSTEKQMIAKGYHDGTGYVEAVDHNIDENILPENIKQGVNILNIVGTLEEGIDTSDATATIADIKRNKTAYVNGQKLTGVLGTIYQGSTILTNLVQLSQQNTIAFYHPADNEVVYEKGAGLCSDLSSIATAINLQSNQIKKDETILGITGTYTSDATALASEIASGKTAYVNGVKLTGTLENLEPVIQNQANVINNLYNTVNLLQDEIDTKANAQFMFVLPEGMRFTNSVTVYNNGLNWDVSKTTDISYLFYACNNLTNLNVSEWNTINITNMRSAFQGCSKLTNLNVTHWDTSNVIQLGSIFYQCSNLRNMDLSNWNTSNLIQMYSMFTYCSNIRNVYMNNWDTSKVNTMSGLFQFCYNLVNINVSNWNTSNVVDMSAMFNDCPNLVNIDVSNWNTSNVERMSQTFAGCSKLKNLDVSNWNTSKVVTMYNTFYTCFNLTNIDVSNWNTSNVTNLNSTFYLCNNLVDINVSNWNINLVTSTYQMFNRCANLVTLNVSNWNSANITAMGQMFNGCNNLSDASIDSIVNMCINAVNVTRKNLSTSNSYSPFCGTNIVNTRYQNRWTELTQSGWVY